jgi:hypothetical protein
MLAILLERVLCDLHSPFSDCIYGAGLSSKYDRIRVMGEPTSCSVAID